MESVKFLENIVFDKNKPVLRTLLPGPGPRVMLLCLSAGQSLPEHTAPNTITVQAISGATTFYDGPVPFEMKSGTLIRLEAHRPHALTAHEDSVLLVTVLGGVVSEEALKSGVLDLRSIPRGQRHPLIFERVAKLQMGESFAFLNDHDPVPLRRQLDSQFAAETSWEYLERGPEVFRVRITRVGTPLQSSGQTTEPVTVGS